MELDVVSLARYMVGAGISVVWGILMLHAILGKHRKEDKRILVFYAGLTCGVLLLMFGASWLLQYMDGILENMTDEQFNDVIYNMGMTSLWMLTDILRMMLPSIAIIVAALAGFVSDRSTKVFTAVLIVLAALVINDYVAPLSLMPVYFNRETEEVGLLVYGLSRLFWYALTYLGFRRYLKDWLSEILDTSDGRMGTFIRVPVISCIAFCLSLSFFSAMGVGYLSGIFMNQIFWSVLLGMLILVYVWMYWAIFRAVTLATESMKTKAELDVASKIQASVLPRTFPAFPECDQFDIYASMDPAKEVGGDFYDFFMIDENRLAVVIADVSGKGVPAALFMMSARTMIKNQSFIETDPAKVLGIVNNQLAENNEEGMFVTTFLAVYDLTTRELTFSNGGHNPPYVVRADGAVEQVAVRPGFVLGGMEGIRYRNQSIQMGIHDKLLLYTDGVTEAVNPQFELYAESRLEKVLEHTEKVSPKETIEKIIGALKEFADGAEQADDITMVVLQICK